MTDSLDGSKPPALSSYTCPGELYSISREVHLARLAAFYVKCRDCVHRIDSERFQDEINRSAPEPTLKSAANSLVTDEGIRGVYLNEIDRNRGVKWGEAFAAYLWDQRPMMASVKAEPSQQIIPDQRTTRQPSAMGAPTVVVGFDERVSSPDIVTGVVLGLRRMGCTAIDLGQTLLPPLAFHIHAKNADGGMYVTGTGRGPSFTGFDFLSDRGGPITRSDLLNIDESVKLGTGRQTRQVGAHRPFQGQREYEESLSQYFHALRPLKIVCGTSTRLLPLTLDRVFTKLPCEIAHVSLPTRQRDLFDPGDVDLVRVAERVIESKADLGVALDADGRHAAFITDQGRLVTAREVARLLIEVVMRHHGSAAVVISSCWAHEAQSWFDGRNAVVFDGGDSTAELVFSLQEKKAALGFSADGRIWFGYDPPVSDAIVSLAGILQALSFSDTPFSEVVSRISDRP